MIARNEAHCIQNAIESVKSIVSEIIVIDTGSIDGTQAIATKCGAVVIEDTWRDDFSYHRNQSIDAASGDWILVLDADEVIGERDLQKITSFVNAQNTCYLLTQRHYTDDHRLSDYQPCRGQFPEYEQNNAGFFESSCIRLFPKHPKIRYQGKVHELVEHSIKEANKFNVVLSGIRIHHYGHTASLRAKKEKHSLYGPLGEKKIREEPKNWQAFFELGVEYNVNGDLNRSIEAFTQAAQLNPNYVPLWINRGYVLCELKRYAESIEDQKRALSLDPRAYEAYGNWGVALMRQGKFNEAIPYFDRALSINPFFVNGFANLARCLGNVGRYTDSSLAFEQAIRFSHGTPGLIVELSSLFVAMGLHDEAIKWLHRTRDIDSAPDALIMLGLAYKKKGASDKSSEIIATLSDRKIPESFETLWRELKGS